MKTLEFQKDDIFFCSDFHFHHKNIVKGVSEWKGGYRNFRTVKEMDETLLKRINNKVKENSILFCLGDWAFGHPYNIVYFRNEIKCKNIHLILGNHDKLIRNNKDNIQSIFTSVENYKEIKVENQRIILFHYPIYSWNGKSHHSWHLYGHVHGKYKNPGLSLDIGVDNYFKLFGEYEPFSYKELETLFKNLEITKYIHTKNFNK